MINQRFDRLASTRRWAPWLCAAIALAWAAPVHGQPVDPWSGGDEEEAPATDAPDDTAPGDAPAPGETDPPPDGATAAPGATESDSAEPSNAFAQSDGEDEEADEDADDEADEEDEVPIVLPNIFNAPTGRLLPAGLIFMSAAVDTGGGVSGEIRAGLGDVAEFGLEVSDLIRARNLPEDEPERIWPYVLATFKMGLGEDQLFTAQPALALGFRKSFSREDGAHTTRAAELYFVASKTLGEKLALHVGGVFWDAELEPIGADPILLHDRGWEKQLRAFGGIEIEPLPDAKILLETFWVPEFCYDDACRPRIKLTPNFAWGVRYEAADWVLIESGVRVPDIKEVNLIDAQIFGQITLVSRKLTKALKKRNR